MSEVRLELSRVIWPKPNEFIGATIIVIILVAIVSTYLAVVDGILFRVVEHILKMFGA